MRDIKFRAWDNQSENFTSKYDEDLKSCTGLKFDTESYFFYYDRVDGVDKRKIRFIFEQFTGLQDKNGVDGYFGDIWEIKDYEYSVKWGKGFSNHKCDLRFILIYHPLEIGYELINPPKGLDFIGLDTIFNLKLRDTERRMFIDDDRKKLEIIGNIHETKESDDV